MTDNDRYRWQEEFLHKYRTLDQENFTLVACPGAGKTRAALRLAKELIETKMIERFWIVCPTRRVQKQWAKAAARLKLEVDHTWENDLCAIPADVDGVAVTYATVNNQPELHRKLVSDRRTLVIFDEGHHLEDNAAWGVSCKRAFEVASRRLMLSGTPFRTEGRIPFVEYETVGGGQYVKADSDFPYWRAVRENVCRAIFFPRKGGKVEYTFDDKEYSHDFDDSLVTREAKRRLRAAIHADTLDISDIAEQIIRDADKKLRELRDEGDTRAAGLVIASTIPHANAIAQHMRRILRLPHVPPVVHSDDDDALHILDRFENGTEPWIVSVKMVSEGVDIPRLRVLAYLTNYATRLYFLQALGRIARGDSAGHCFMPDDWTLRAFAEQVYREREQALKEIEEGIPGDSEPSEEDPPTKDRFRFKSAEGNDAGVIFDSHRIDRDEYNEARQHLEGSGGWPPPVSHEIIARFVLANRTKARPVDDLVSPLKSERKEDLRRQQNKLVQRYCFLTGAEYAIVNNDLNKYIGIIKLKLATEEQLIKRLERVKELLKTTEK